MTDGLPSPQRIFAFMAVALAMTMAVLDGAIVNIALPAMGADLHVTPSQSIWVVNAYQLAVTVALLPLATLGDIAGYKRVYLGGLIVFTLASLACAQSQSLAFLTVARILQGLGAAGLMSVNIALVRFIFPRAQLGAGVGYMSLVVAASSVAGPSIASAILALAHWQWLFLVNLPIGVLALVVGARALPRTAASGHKFDALSAMLNALTFGLIIAGLSEFSSSQTSLNGAAMLAVGLAIGVAFVWRERQLALPMLPVDLLRMPVFALSLVTSICSFAAQSMAMVSLPFYFEQTLGRSPTETGLLMTPWPLVTALVAPVAGRLSDRLRPEKLSSVGLVLFAAGLGSLGFLGDTASWADIAWRMALAGLGFGLFQSPNNRVIVSSAPRERSGGASGIQSMGRLLGQSLGAVMVAMAFGWLHVQHTAGLICGGAAVLSLMAAAASGLRKSQG
jgi:DHA2 family multidrug resistance protein-like MFS transporter